MLHLHHTALFYFELKKLHAFWLRPNYGSSQSHLQDYLETKMLLLRIIDLMTCYHANMRHAGQGFKTEVLFWLCSVKITADDHHIHR